MPPVDQERAARLRRARIDAGHARVVDGWRAFRARHPAAPSQSDYTNWENGNRHIPARWRALLAETFGVNLVWLETGQGSSAPLQRNAPLEGMMVALAEIIPNDATDAELIDLPEATTEALSAYRVVGDANSLTYNEGDIIFARHDRSQNPETLINKLCIVTTPDGRRWVRHLLRGATAGLFTLFQVGGVITPDVRITDAAPIVYIKKAI